jgi:hypothetical protein
MRTAPVCDVPASGEYEFDTAHRLGNKLGEVGEMEIRVIHVVDDPVAGVETGPVQCVAGTLHDDQVWRESAEKSPPLTQFQGCRQNCRLPPQLTQSCRYRVDSE